MRRFKFLSVLAASIALIGLLWSAGGTQTTRTFIAKELPLVIDSVGPHAIGGATASDTQVKLLGSFSGARLLWINTVLSPAIGSDAYALAIEPTLVEAASGNHTIMAALRVLGTVTAGVGTVSELTTLRVEPITAATGTTDASTLKIIGAPTGATNNYALWVAAGAIRVPLGGGNQEISVDAVDTAGAGFRALRVPN